MPRWLQRRHNCAATGPPLAAPRTPRKKRSTIAVNDLKRTHRVTWAAGDYAAVAEHIDEAPPRDLLARAELGPGLDVLDVATGTGNIALRAAAAGCTVVGPDLTPELFGTARHRAERLGVTIEWIEGDECRGPNWAGLVKTNARSRRHAGTCARSRIRIGSRFVPHIAADSRNVLRAVANHAAWTPAREARRPTGRSRAG